MLSDKFFEAFKETGEKPPAADPPETEKMYTAAEVDALVNDKVEAAVNAIKESMSKPEDPAVSKPEEPAESE